MKTIDVEEWADTASELLDECAGYAGLPLSLLDSIKQLLDTQHMAKPPPSGITRSKWQPVEGVEPLLRDGDMIEVKDEGATLYILYGEDELWLTLPGNLRLFRMAKPPPSGMAE